LSKAVESNAVISLSESISKLIFFIGIAIISWGEESSG
jgi:hypothetical protein